MAYYGINCEQCSKEAENILKLEKEMLQYIRQIEGIEKELGKLSGFGTVVSALAKTREELYHEKDSMKQMGEVLHASIQCYKNTEKKLSRLKPESSIAKPKDGEADAAAGEGIHFALDCLGLIPGIGAVFDGINACWYLCEGRWGEALLSGLALIPAVGIAAGVGKIGGKTGMKAISHADDIAGIAKGLGKLDDSIDVAKRLDKLENASDVMKYGDDMAKDSSRIIPNAKSLQMTQTVQSHINDVIKKGSNAGQRSRPYIDSNGTTLLLKEIMETKAPVPDIILQSGLRWDVTGTFRGTTGMWELVIDTSTNKVVHFNFVAQ